MKQPKYSFGDELWCVDQFGNISQTTVSIIEWLPGAKTYRYDREHYEVMLFRTKEEAQASGEGCRFHKGQWAWRCAHDKPVRIKIDNVFRRLEGYMVLTDDGYVLPEDEVYSIREWAAAAVRENLRDSIADLKATTGDRLAKLEEALAKLDADDDC